MTTTGTALSFKNDTIDLMTGDLGPDLPGGNAARTLELWARFSGQGSWLAEHTIVELGRRTSGPNQVFGIDMAGRDAALGRFDPYTNGLGDNDPTPLMLGLDGWHHLAWAYDGMGHFQFVVDGVKAALPRPGDGSGTLQTTQGIVTLGGSQSFGLEGWEGALDELRLWTIFRSEAEISRDMKVKLGGDEPGLVAYYDFDEGSGMTANDVAKRPGHKLAFCTNNGGPCPSNNNAAPQWVPSDIPGPFSCRP